MPHTCILTLPTYAAMLSLIHTHTAGGRGRTAVHALQLVPDAQQRALRICIHQLRARVPLAQRGCSRRCIARTLHASMSHKACHSLSACLPTPHVSVMRTELRWANAPTFDEGLVFRDTQHCKWAHGLAAALAQLRSAGQERPPVVNVGSRASGHAASQVGARPGCRLGAAARWRAKARHLS